MMSNENKKFFHLQTYTRNVYLCKWIHISYLNAIQRKIVHLQIYTEYV